MEIVMNIIRITSIIMFILLIIFGYKIIPILFPDNCTGHNEVVDLFNQLPQFIRMSYLLGIFSYFLLMIILFRMSWLDGGCFD